MAEYLGKEYSDLNDMALHNDDGKDDNNVNIKDVEVVEIGSVEIFFISNIGFCLELGLLNSETDIGTGVG